jgi:hypothetical protein
VPWRRRQYYCCGLDDSKRSKQQRYLGLASTCCRLTRIALSGHVMHALIRLPQALTASSQATTTVTSSAHMKRSYLAGRALLAACTVPVSFLSRTRLLHIPLNRTPQRRQPFQNLFLLNLMNTSRKMHTAAYVPSLSYRMSLNLFLKRFQNGWSVNPVEDPIYCQCRPSSPP